MMVSGRIFAFSSTINSLARMRFLSPLLVLAFVYLVQPARAQSSTDALAPVKYENKWAYIDKTGSIVLPGIFENAGSFAEGLAPVQIGSKWGYITPDGKWAVKPIFLVAYGFNNNRAFAHFYDKVDTFDHPIYINRKGEFIHELVWGEAGHDYHDGLVRVESSDINGPAIGFRDTTGAWLIKPHYDAAMDFSGGYAAVMLGTTWGFIDRNDKYLVFPKYTEVAPFHEGYAWIKDAKKQYFIDNKGATVLKVSNSKEVAPAVSEGLIAYREKGKVGFMDIKGKTVIKPAFDNQFLPAFSEGLAPVQQNGKYGYIDKTGKLVIPCQYDEAFAFHQGLARIKMKNKFGFIDNTGKVILEPKLDDAKDFTPTY
jgi:hypothetical protein